MFSPCTLFFQRWGETMIIIIIIIVIIIIFIIIIFIDFCLIF